MSAARAHGLDRRGLLLGGAGALALLGLARRASAAGPSGGGGRRGSVLGAGLARREAGEQNLFSAVDLDRPDTAARTVELDFYGHGMALHPRDPARVAVFEKGGAGACLLDLAEGRVRRAIAPGEGRDFYGHGAFSPDGTLLYATQREVGERYRGVVVVRDADTLAEHGTFPTFGVNPHDCVLRDGGATLVVTNGGTPAGRGGEAPSVAWVDVERRTLLERVAIPDPDLGAGHLALAEAGDLAVVSAERRGTKLRDGVGGLSLRPRGAGMRTLLEPFEVTGRFRGEVLSVAIHEPSGVVGVTNPFGALVTFWDLATGRFLRSVDLSLPRGIAVTLDGGAFVVSYGRSTSLVEISTETLEPVPGSRRTGLDLQSSHVVVHAL